MSSPRSTAKPKKRNKAKMASPATNSNAREDEPLLGQPGDAQQPDQQPLYKNLILGTAPLAQFGALILVGIVWGAVFTHDVILFSAHPLLNSFGILLFIQSILLLQPTSTQKQKINGTVAHSTLNNIGGAALIAGLVLIVYNKALHNGTHFESPHAILGLITYSLMAIQVIVGGSMFFVPQLYGGAANAKKLYKYHRVSGYLLLVMFLVVVGAATRTDYNINILHIKLWSVVVVGVVLVAGIVPRVRKSKFGL